MKTDSSFPLCSDGVSPPSLFGSESLVVAGKDLGYGKNSSVISSADSGSKGNFRVSASRGKAKFVHNSLKMSKFNVRAKSSVSKAKSLVTRHSTFVSQHDKFHKRDLSFRKVNQGISQRKPSVRSSSWNNKHNDLSPAFANDKSFVQSRYEKSSVRAPRSLDTVFQGSRVRSGGSVNNRQNFLKNRNFHPNNSLLSSYPREKNSGGATVRSSSGNVRPHSIRGQKSFSGLELNPLKMNKQLISKPSSEHQSDSLKKRVSININAVLRNLSKMHFSDKILVIDNGFLHANGYIGAESTPVKLFGIPCDEFKTEFKVNVQSVSKSLRSFV